MHLTRAEHSPRELEETDRFERISYICAYQNKLQRRIRDSGRWWRAKAQTLMRGNFRQMGGNEERRRDEAKCGERGEGRWGDSSDGRKTEKGTYYKATTKASTQATYPLGPYAATCGTPRRAKPRWHTRSSKILITTTRTLVTTPTQHG